MIRVDLAATMWRARTASSTVPFVPLTFGPAQSFAAGSGAVRCDGDDLLQVLSTGDEAGAGVWVFNAMVRRPVTDRIELQANMYNLANRFYIDQPHPSHLIPGAG